MSGRYMTAVLHGLQDPELPSGAKLTALALADCANNAHVGLAWPSVGTIARLASISTRQAREHLRALEKRGWIEVEERLRGRSKTTHYRLNLRRMHAIIKSKKAEADRRLSDAESIRKGGSAPPGNEPQKAEVHPEKAEVQRTKGGSAPPKRRKQSSAELEVTGNITRIEPSPRGGANVGDIAASSQTLFKKILNGEPEDRSRGEAPKPMTREEQIAAARRLAEEQAKD